MWPWNGGGQGGDYGGDAGGGDAGNDHGDVFWMFIKLLLGACCRWLIVVNK